QEFVIGGYTPGNPFDALIVGYYEDGKLLYAAKVRNGFVLRVRCEVASKFKGLEIDTCPFSNLPEQKPHYRPVARGQAAHFDSCTLPSSEAYRAGPTRYRGLTSCIPQ